MSSKISQRMNEAMNRSQELLDAEWQGLTDAVGSLITKIHEATRALLAENASLKKEIGAALCFLEEGKVSYTSLEAALKQRIAVLTTSIDKLSSLVEKLEKSTFDGAGFGQYEESLREFSGYAAIHTHPALNRKQRWIETSPPQ